MQFFKKVLGYLLRPLFRFSVRQNFPAPDMELAFQVGGKSFFAFKSEMGIPVERALSAQDVYTELDMGIDREYLEVFFESLVKLLDSGKLVDAASITKLAQSRLKHISNLGLMYKLASIYYVEENEDPYNWDFVIAEQKIAFWQAHEKDIEAFFLKTPIGRLLPSLGNSAMNLATYFLAQQEELSRILEQHMSLLSDVPGAGDVINILKSQKSRANEMKAFLSTP